MSAIVLFNLYKHTFSCKFRKMFMNPTFRENSGVKLLFEHSPSQAGEIDYFEIFRRPQPRENQLAR